MHKVNVISHLMRYKKKPPRKGLSSDDDTKLLLEHDMGSGLIWTRIFGFMSLKASLFHAALKPHMIFFIGWIHDLNNKITNCKLSLTCTAFIVHRTLCNGDSNIKQPFKTYLNAVYFYWNWFTCIYHYFCSTVNLRRVAPFWRRFFFQLFKRTFKWTL